MDEIEYQILKDRIFSDFINKYFVTCDEKIKSVVVKVNTHGNDMPDNHDGKGDWFDLKTSEEVTLKKDEYTKIPLGLSFELPKGYTMMLEPRSSTLFRYGLVGITGVIDSTYCGDDDIVMFAAYSTRDVTIPIHTPIAQITIVRKTRFVFDKVEHLCNKNRGGFGSTDA